ncbi:hypothetical protein ACNOYE_19415 [Nannocystaceae bacterium ST9]
MPGGSDPSKRARALRALALFGLAFIVMLAWLRPTRTAELVYEGRTYSLPLPVWSVRLDHEEGKARYLGLGDPSFGSMGEFEYVEQLGSGHVLTRDDLRLEIVTRKRSRPFTEISLSLSPRSE